MSVSLRDVVLAVSYGDASLVGESAGYLILGAADIALRTCERGSLDSITIDEEGTVRLAGPAVEEYEAEGALRGFLGMLLGKVRIPSNNLARVAARREPRGLRGLVAELEAALVPVNRRAARRTLARLCREAQKSAAREHTFAEVEEVPRMEAVFVAPPEPVVDSQRDAAPKSEPVEDTPSPAPDVVHETRATRRVEHAVVTHPRRASQRPTVPARPDATLLERLAGSYGAATPVEPAPVVDERGGERPASAAVDSRAQIFEEDFASEDEDEFDSSFDSAETQVFAGVLSIVEQESGRELWNQGLEAAVVDSTFEDVGPDFHRAQEQRVREQGTGPSAVVQPDEVVEPTQVVGRQVVPNAKVANATASARRRPTTSKRPQRALSDEDSLIVMSESAPRRATSDISDLLDKMAISATSTEELYVGLKSLSRIDLSPVAPPVGAAWIDEERR